MSSAQSGQNRSKGAKARSRFSDVAVPESKAVLELKHRLERLHRTEFSSRPIRDEETSPTTLLRFEIEGSIYHLGRFPRPKKPLSPKERKIVALLAEGKPDKSIARELGMSEGTLATHLRRIRRKLGVTTRAEIVQLSPYLL
jgi:DNA-binding CsgD family transcriptional regulator